jgi:hypothetical protein
MMTMNQFFVFKAKRGTCNVLVEQIDGQGKGEQSVRRIFSGCEWANNTTSWRSPYAPASRRGNFF